MVDPSVIAGISAALEAAPDNDPLRLHLATLLADTDPAEALKHCAVLLARKPDHTEALRLAALAADATGDKPRAEGYRRLHQALATPAKDSPAPPPAKQVKAGKDPEVDPDEESERDSDDDAEPHAAAPGGRRLRLVQGGGDPEQTSPWEVERETVTLADVAGMETVKKRLRIAFLEPMKNPKMMKAFGKSLRGGLLLYGPPGCGKTFIARATAGELGARFMAVGLSDVLDMWLGQSERNLHEVFETARRNAPCVLFFDEVDALGRKRSLVRNSAEHNVINQLLSELDSVKADNQGLFILAATNHPWDVDTALRRPGRLDRTLLVLPPDKQARESVLRYHLKDRPTEGIDVGWLAGKTDGFSGADLAHLCDSATEYAMEDSIESGVTRSITMADAKRALKEVKPSTRPWFDIARNYAQFSNEGGAYDDLLQYLREQRFI
jgi:SpoVK/Ycf46/Vps4 family AAA+-type ATPase